MTNEPSQVSSTGGCQCGGVRYRLDAAPGGSTVCHCRMCQKAGGGPFMVFASVPNDAFVVTHGTMAVFASSDIAERGFCSACGTPLTYHRFGSDHISMTTGSLDDPGVAPPESQLGVEGRVAWLSEVLALPALRTEQWLASKNIAEVGSHQHPDHDD